MIVHLKHLICIFLPLIVIVHCIFHTQMFLQEYLYTVMQNCIHVTQFIVFVCLFPWYCYLTLMDGLSNKFNKIQSSHIFCIQKKKQLLWTTHIIIFETVTKVSSWDYFNLYCMSFGFHWRLHCQNFCCLFWSIFI